MFTQQDHDDLEQAATLVQGVMDRHPHDIDMQTISFLCGAIQEIRMGERYVDYKAGNR